MTTHVLVAVLAAALGVGAGRLARQAWGWGAAMPARFTGLQDVYRMAPVATLFCGAVSVVFAFLAGTHGALDEDGGAATWQLVAIAPVGAVWAAATVACVTIRYWNRPEMLVPPALRGDRPLLREEVVEPVTSRFEAHEFGGRIVPDDVNARPWTRGSDPRFQGDRERRRRRELAAVAFVIPVGFATVGTFFGLGARGDGGVVSPSLAFVHFVGVGVALSAYGALILTGRLPSVLHGAIPRRTAGLGVLTVGAVAYAVGAVAAGDLAAIAAATTGSAVLCAMAVRVTRRGARSAGGLRAMVTLVSAAVLWSAVAVWVLR